VTRTTTTQQLIAESIAKFKQQKKARFEAKSGPRKKSLPFVFFLKKLMQSKGS
jgi:hypothetical protein